MTARVANDRTGVPPEARSSPGNAESRSVTELGHRANLVWTVVGSISAALGQWGILFVLVKFGSLESVGVYGLAIAICNPVLMFSNLQLGNVLATDASGERAFSTYLSLRVVTSAVAIIGLVLFAQFGSFGEAVSRILVTLAIAKGVEAVSDICYGQMQRQGRMDFVAGSLTLRAVSTAGVVGYCMSTTGSLVVATMAIALTWAVALFAIDLPLTRWTGAVPDDDARRPSSGQLLRLALHVLPLGSAMLLASLIASAPSLYVGQHLGLEALGVFVPIASLLVLGRKLINPITQTASVRLAKHYLVGNRDAFRNDVLGLFGFSTAIGLTGLVVAWLFGQLVLGQLFTEEHARHHELLVWLMLAMLLMIQANLDPVFVVLRCHGLLLGLWTLTLAVLTAVLYLFSWRNDLIGVAQAMALANGLRLVVTLGVLAFVVGRRFDDRIRPAEAT